MWLGYLFLNPVVLIQYIYDYLRMFNLYYTRSGFGQINVYYLCNIPIIIYDDKVNIIEPIIEREILTLKTKSIM